MPEIRFEVPHGLGLAIATAILAKPVSFYPAHAAKSVDADWTHDDLGSGPDTVIVTFPDPPRPTIPELIAKWHAESTSANYHALRLALVEHRTAFVHHGDSGRTAYFATERQGVPTIEVY